MADTGLMPDYGLGAFNVPGYGELARSILPPEPQQPSVVPAPVTAPAPMPAPQRFAAAPPRPSLTAGLPELPQPKQFNVGPPPKPEYHDPIMALGKPLALIALLGSLFTRQSATNAMNAMASAAMAQRQGDQEKYQNAYREYQQELEKVKNEQQQDIRTYEMALQNRKMTFDERYAEARMVAAKRKDSIMQQALSGQGPVADPMQLLEARMKAGKPVTEAEIKVASMTDLMKKNPGMTMAQASQAYEKGKQEGKEEGKPKKPEKPLTMTQENAKDIEARTKRIMQAEPGIDEDVARTRALAAFNTDRKAPAGSAWATLDPVIQNVATAFPEARDKLSEGTYKLPPARQANLLAGLKVVKENDRVAKYVAENPDAVGILPIIYNRYHSTLVSHPKIDVASTEEAAAYAEKIANQQAADIRSLGGKMVLPDGRRLDPGLAERAAILNKMLIQTGLSDAAQMSASGRGGTIYLDKLMTEKIYNQQTNPFVLLNFLADRSAPAASRWKELDSHIDLASPSAPPEYRSLLLTPGGIESLLGQAYPDKRPPAPGTIMDGYRFKGGNPADKGNWERVQ